MIQIDIWQRDAQGGTVSNGITVHVKNHDDLPCTVEKALRAYLKNHMVLEDAHFIYIAIPVKDSENLYVEDEHD